MFKATKILFLIILLSLGLFFFILSTTGIETKKFNSLITKKISESNTNVSVLLNEIKFKLDIKEISLFLETSKPQIKYFDADIPAKSIKVYIDFSSLYKASVRIKKIYLSLEELDFKQFRKLISVTKPSNFRSLVGNKVKEGKITSEIEFYLNRENLLENFIAKGKVVSLRLHLVKNLSLKNIKFGFFADNSDILLKNIEGQLNDIEIKEGDLNLKILPEIQLQSNFSTKAKLNTKSLAELSKLSSKFKFIKGLKSLDANLKNSILINFDETYKITDYKIENKGKIIKANFKFKEPIYNYLSANDITEIFFNDSEIITKLNNKQNNISISGKYALNNNNFLKFGFENNIIDSISNLNLNFDYKDNINLNLINYQKSDGKLANIDIKLKKTKDNINFDEINLIENKNSIFIKDLKFKNDNFHSLKKISVKTHKNGEKNNDFSLKFGSKILINGLIIDATNLSKFLNKNSQKNNFKNLSKNIEINLENVKAPLSKNLTNFRLIGYLDRGKFIKISSKGDFSESEFLDISMKNDETNNKKYLEIYSDLARPLLVEYNFFEGLVGGNLFFSSIIENDNSISKLRIENFKVRNAPGMVKLLSLADLGGLADLAEGEGLSFEVLEINFNKSKNLTKFNEILATGPSISVLMEGYQEKNGLTSLRGTLVPAKNLNKLISKIPVVGEIIIPKEVGEGLFGISFKMKGPEGKVKTSINPIRTVTPRFIQKIIERKKSSN